jgi:hypothetical protein
LTDSPDALIHSPAEIDAAWPTMAMRSRCPGDLAPKAQNPLSSLVAAVGPQTEAETVRPGTHAAPILMRSESR